MRVFLVDTNAMLGAVFRAWWRRLLQEPELSFYLADAMREELLHELGRRLARIEQAGAWPAEVVDDWRRALPPFLETHIGVVAQPVYAPWEAEARERIPRDAADWPTVASALALSAEIVTNDADFLGCGVAVWTPETLRTHLRRHGVATE